MAQVFVSYSRRDLAFVERMAQDLMRAGVDVWYDLSGLEGGEKWGDKIQSALRGSVCVIVVLSPDSIISEWVEREFLFASNLKKKILPLLYRECELPFNYLNLNYIDVQEGNYEKNFPNILKAIDSGPLTMVSKSNTVRSVSRKVAPRPRQSNTSKYIIGCALAGLAALAVVASIAGLFLMPRLFPASPATIGSNATPTISTPMVAPTTPSMDIAVAVPTTVTPSPTATTTATATPSPTITASPTPSELCGLLAGKSININANNFPGVIGPAGISLTAGGSNSFSFTTVAAFAKERVDTVSGQCKANTLTFTRTRPQEFVQVFTGALAQNSTGAVSINGMFSNQNGKQASWSGSITNATTPSDLCWRIAMKSIAITVGSFNGTIGSSGMILTDAGNGTYKISTDAAFTNEPRDPVAGKCSGNTLTFTRTRTGAFVQTYSGVMQDSGGAVVMQGSLVDQNGGQASWSGRVIE